MEVARRGSHVSYPQACAAKAFPVVHDIMVRGHTEKMRACQAAGSPGPVAPVDVEVKNCRRSSKATNTHRSFRMINSTISIAEESNRSKPTEPLHRCQW